MADLYVNNHKIVEHLTIHQQVKLNNLQPLQQYQLSLKNRQQELASQTVTAPPKLYLVEAREKNLNRNYLLNSTNAWTATGGHDNVLSGNNWLFSFGNIANAPFKGQIVTFSARYKCVGTGNTGTLNAQFNGHPLGFDSYKLPMTDSGQFVHSFVWNPNFSGEAAGLGFRIDGMAATRTVTVDQVKLELGEYATIWTPAPEDLSVSTTFQIQQIIEPTQTKVKVELSGLANSLWLVALKNRHSVGEQLTPQDFAAAFPLNAANLTHARLATLGSKTSNIIDLSMTDSRVLRKLQVKNYIIGDLEVGNG